MANSDAELAAAAGGGDGAAFAELYDRHGASVYSFCLRVLGSPHDATDATQETFLSVLERLRDPEAEPIENLRAYLLTSARHASWRVLERRKKIVSDTAVPDAASAAAGAEALVLTRDLQDEVRDANAALPVRQREVLALREVEGLSYEEIGTVMDLRPNAAAQLAWRARASFKAAVRKGSLRGIAPRGRDCELALTLLELREDAPLDDESEAWLEEHLAQCERCSASKAFMLEAGATYRAWAPTLGAVAAMKAGLLDQAGALVGLDWSAHGAAAAAGSGSASGSGGSAGGGAAGSPSSGSRVPPAGIG